MDNRVVIVANRFAAHWAGGYGQESGAQAAAGVWPLLALLADGAREPGRGELAAALGVDADAAVAAACEVWGILDSSAGVSAALGLWTKADVPISSDWLDRLPVGAVMELDADVAVSRERLDEWVRSSTGGLASRMPVELSRADVLMIASALFLRTAWVQPFSEGPMSVDDGPWRGRRLDALRRKSFELDHVGVARTAAGELTAARIVGDDEIDVVLVLGEPDASAAEVLEHGVRLVAGEYQAVPGSQFTEDFPGPGLTWKTVGSATPGDHVALHLPTFSVINTLDLLQTPEVFGLSSVMDGRRGHFPGVSSKPLAVSRAAQAMAVSFTAKGFGAAAVTAITMVCEEGAAEPSHQVRRVAFVIDRPFGFVAVHRDSGLIVLAGWVEEPGQAASA